METTTSIGSNLVRWRWDLIMADLETKGGLPGVIINRLSARDNSFGGKTKKDTHFTLKWLKDKSMVLIMTQDEIEFVCAFSKILEYKPFCRYSEVFRKGKEIHSLVTYEWDKVDPIERFAQLERNPEIIGLKRLWDNVVPFS